MWRGQHHQAQMQAQTHYATATKLSPRKPLHVPLVGCRPERNRQEYRSSASHFKEDPRLSLGVSLTPKRDMSFAIGNSQPANQSVSQSVSHPSVLVGYCAQSTRAPIPCGALRPAHAVRALLAGTCVSPPQALRSSPPPAFASNALHRASSSGTLVKRSSSSGGGTSLGSRLHAVLVTAARPCGRRLALRDLRHDHICQQEGLGHGHGVLQSAAHHLMEARGPRQGDRSAGVTQLQWLGNSHSVLHRHIRKGQRSKGCISDKTCKL